MVDGRHAADRNTCPPSVHRLIEAGASELRIRTGRKNIGIDRPGAAEHKTGNRRAGEKILGDGVPG